jgi:hypothetical protein
MPRELITPTLDELKDWLKQHQYVWYRRPVDLEPQIYTVMQYTISNRTPDVTSAMTIWSPEGGWHVVFIAKHLDRFRFPKGQN